MRRKGSYTLDGFIPILSKSRIVRLITRSIDCAQRGLGLGELQLNKNSNELLTKVGYCG